MTELSHVDQKGRVQMVDVTKKKETAREAEAFGSVTMQPATLEKIKQNSLEKGPVLETARIAGIMAVKKTAELIPLCHQLLISGVTISFEYKDERTIGIRVKVRTSGKTGVEMEALTGVSVAALTIYDMCKAVDREMVIGEIKLLKKTGGKSGNYIRKDGK